MRRTGADAGPDLQLQDDDNLGSNLSIKDGDGNIWITPARIDKGQLSPKDIVRVKPDEVIAELRATFGL